MKTFRHTDTDFTDSDYLFDSYTEDAPARYPELQSFFDDGWITDVLHVVKSGKEATVYCCEAGPSTGVPLLAAKVYRSRDHRSFKNDAVYQGGRVILDRRQRRAFEKVSHYGREVQQGMWIHAEWETLNLLHSAGADVPKPYARAENALLMEYVGDEDGPAAPLHKARLDPQEARELFGLLMRNIELWLRHDRIHADLSAYNILYHEGALTIIDFPQAVDPRFNKDALSLLERDVANVCSYFARQGVQTDPHRLARDLWRGFVRGTL